MRGELSALPGSLAEKVASHLVMAGRLLDDEPELARAHAETAYHLAPRITAAREALAIAAYTSGDYRTALREARTVRRMSGDDGWLPLIADCERGLGRPERALDLLVAAPLQDLPDDVRAECLIVLGGARRDLGQPEAALAALDTDLLRRQVKSEWAARLRLAYAETLADLDRDDEADRWLRFAVASDPSGASGAAERLAELDGVDIITIDDDVDDGELASDGVDAVDPDDRAAHADGDAPADDGEFGNGDGAGDGELGDADGDAAADAVPAAEQDGATAVDELPAAAESAAGESDAGGS